MKQSQPNPICISVFKNGGSATTKEEFTKMWIELINMVEKGKTVCCGKRKWER